MKTNIYLIALLFTLFCLASCTKDPEPEPEPEPRWVLPREEIGSLMGKPEVILVMQADPALMAADRIIREEGRYVLDLSPEEAAELMIPEAVYQSFVQQVDALNKAPDAN